MSAHTLQKNWVPLAVMIVITIVVAMLIFNFSKTTSNPTHSAAGDGQSKITLGGNKGGSVGDKGV